MKKVFLFGLLAALIVGVLGIALNRRATVHAQQSERLTTESLGITHGQALVADLAAFPDGTKLILRDPDGRLGMILSVSGRAGAERAQIEFYDANGQLLHRINASSSGGLLEERIKRLEDISLPIPYTSGQRRTQSNLENLWIKLGDLEGRVSELEKK